MRNGASGLYATSAAQPRNFQPIFTSASSSGHYATLPLAAQGDSSAEQPIADARAQLAALAAHCRSVFESDPIIRSNIDRRFNTEYQDLHDKVPRNNLQIKQREVDLKATLDAFRQYSEVVSELIILQQQLPADMHVIQAAADLGGLAGGEKFKVGHVVFKFARDWQHIYGAFVVCVCGAANSNSAFELSTKGTAFCIFHFIMLLRILFKNTTLHDSYLLCCNSAVRFRPSRVQGVVCRDALFAGGD